MLKDKHLFADGSKGYLALVCPACGYSIEDCQVTHNFVYCPLCAPKSQIKLQPRFIVTFPKYEVMPPEEMERRVAGA